MKIKNLIRLTNYQSAHGDYDDMGEAINLVNNFKVEKVKFNNVEYNDLANTFIKILNEKNMLCFVFTKIKIKNILFM